MSISSEKLRKVLHPNSNRHHAFFASNPAEILALKASTAQLTGQQWSRAIPDPKRANIQRLGSIKPNQEWDAVLMVLMNQTLETQEIWKAERDGVVAALTAPGGKARNQRGALSVSKFRQIGTRVWPKTDEPDGCGGISGPADL